MYEINKNAFFSQNCICLHFQMQTKVSALFIKINATFFMLTITRKNLRNEV